MKREKFEQKCALAKLKLIGRADFDGVVSFVADGYSNGAAEMPEPHYRTIYALGPDPEKLMIMQSIYHKLGEGLGLNNMQGARVQDAFHQARDAAKVLKDGGLIKSN